MNYYCRKNSDMNVGDTFDKYLFKDLKNLWVRSVTLTRFDFFLCI